MSSLLYTCFYEYSVFELNLKENVSHVQQPIRFNFHCRISWKVNLHLHHQE